MPGTAVGSAPQESWHGQSLKNLVHVRGSTPYDLAVKLRSTVLAWEVEKLQTMKREGRRFEDWPQAERHLDQQVLKGDVALARQGRTSAKRIFELQQHVRWKDPADNVWFMVPSSMLAVAGTYGKKKTYQLHQPVTLPRNALPFFKAFKWWRGRLVFPLSTNRNRLFFHDKLEGIGYLPILDG